jgi:hypothetical protein
MGQQQMANVAGNLRVDPSVRWRFFRQPVDRMHNLAARLCHEIPQLRGRERQLLQALTFEARRERSVSGNGAVVKAADRGLPGFPAVMLGEGRGGVLNPHGQMLTAEEARFPEIVTRAVQRAGNMGEDAATRADISAALVRSELFVENEQTGATAVQGEDAVEVGLLAPRGRASVITRKLPRPAAVRLGFWREMVGQMIQDGFGAKSPTGGPANDASISSAVALVEERLTQSARPQGMVLVPDFNMTWKTGRRSQPQHQELEAVDSFLRKVMFAEVFVAAIAKRAELGIFNELVRWYHNYNALLMEALQPRHTRAEDWDGFDVKLSDMFSRLQVLEKAIHRNGKLTRADIFFPQSFFYVSPKVRRIIRDDLLSLEATGRRKLNYMVLPDALIVRSAAHSRHNGMLQIGRVTYDLSDLGECVVVPFKTFARVYCTQTGRRLAEFRYPVSRGFIKRKNPVRVEANADFTSPRRVFASLDHVLVGPYTYLGFRGREYGKGDSLYIDAGVIAHGVVNTYAGNRFVGAVNPGNLWVKAARVRDGWRVTSPFFHTVTIAPSPRWKEEIPGINIERLLCGVQQTELLGSRLAGKKTMGRRVARRVSNLKMHKVVYKFARSRDVFADEVVFRNLRVSPCRSLGIFFILARLRGQGPHQIIGIDRLRRRGEFEAIPKVKGAGGKNVLARRPYVSFDELAAVTPELGAKGVKNFPGSREKKIIVGDRDLSMPAFARDTIFAQPGGRDREGEFDMWDGRTYLGTVDLAGYGQPDVAFADLGRFPGAAGLFPPVLVMEQSRRGSFGWQGREYVTRQSGSIALHLRPPSGELPFAEIPNRGRAILEGDALEGETRGRQFVYVAPLFEAFHPFCPWHNNFIEIYPDGQKARKVVIPQSLFNQGMRYARVLRDQLLLVDATSAQIQFAVPYRSLLDGGELVASARSPLSFGLPEGLCLADINRVYRAMHAAGVVAGDAKGSLLSMHELAALLHFTGTFDDRAERDLVYLLKRCGRSLFAALAMNR